MRPDEVIKYRDKPVEYGGSQYILRAARIRTESDGKRYPQLRLQDAAHPWSYVVARLEEVKAIPE